MSNQTAREASPEVGKVHNAFSTSSDFRGVRNLQLLRSLDSQPHALRSVGMQNDLSKYGYQHILVKQVEAHLRNCFYRKYGVARNPLDLVPEDNTRTGATPEQEPFQRQAEGHLTWLQLFCSFVTHLTTLYTQPSRQFLPHPAWNPAPGMGKQHRTLCRGSFREIIPSMLHSCCFRLKSEP